MIAPIFGENPITGLDEQFRIDPHNRSMPTETVEYLYKHLGKYFRLNGPLSLTAGASRYFMAIIPVDIHVHVAELLVKLTDGPTIIQLFEAPTISANGTPITAINVNRESTNPSVLAIYDSPTVTAEGTSIFYDSIPSGHNIGGLGGAGAGEYILKAATSYLFKVTNTGIVTATGSFEFEWVETTLPED